MRVGSLVECVKQFVSHPTYGEKFPVLGKVYTVRDIVMYNEASLLLEEIVNPKYLYQQGVTECCFFIDNFRELLPPISNIEEHINENTLELEPC